MQQKNCENIVNKKLGGYLLIESLGSGGFSSVYQAKQESTGQVVALKILKLADHSEKQRRRRQKERFEREAQLCSELHHPNIIKLLDKGQDGDDLLYAVFEYIPGQTLKQLLQEKGSLTAMETGDLMGQVLDALSSAHAQGVIHRDLKPHNIMITETGTRPHVKVLDFGIGAFLPETREKKYKTLTLTQEALGTPSYSAPEQIRGEPATARADLYSWGLIFIECLTGKPVVQGASLAEIFHKQLSPTPVSLPSAIVDHPLGELLRRALNKNQKNRTENAKQLYSDFRALNLNNIVGNIVTSSDSLPDWNSTLEETVENSSIWSVVHLEQRQITVLCYSLNITAITDTPPELEVIDALQRDQLNLCADTVVKYGGFIAETMGDSVMVYFGYPKVNDNSARLAARTALELIGQVRRRSALLKQGPGFKLEISIGMHTGGVLTREDSIPSGLTPNIAQRLGRIAKPGTILASDASQDLLGQYLEFEPSNAYPIDGSQKPTRTYRLIGELHMEALSFLHKRHSGLSLIGRDKELEQLRQLWYQVQKRRRKSVFLTGEAGIGKSRLVYETRGIVRNDGYLSKECQCLPEYQNNALHPFLTLLKQHLILEESQDPAISIKRLASLLQQCECNPKATLPILCSWLSLPLPEGFDSIVHSPERQKQILLEVLEQLILKLGDQKPFLLIVEDLHWIDPVSLELLERLIDSTSENAFFLILTARPEFTLPRENIPVKTIKLRRLSATNAEIMIQQAAGNVTVEKEALSLLSERTDGIPLFIEELIKMLLDKDFLLEQDGTFVLNQQFDAASVPITLQDFLNQRLGQPGPVKEIAQLASAIGREFDYELLVNIALWDEATVQGYLDQIIAAGLVYQKRNVQGERFVFRHALIRDAAYNSMLRSAREQVHMRIAETLKECFPEKVENDSAIIAQHYADAGAYEKAVQCGTLAAKNTLGRSLYYETRIQAENVQKWLSEIPSEKQLEAEIEINVILTMSLMSKYGWAAPQITPHIERSQELLLQTKNSDLTLTILWSLLIYYHVAGDSQTVLNLVDQLELIFNQSDDMGEKVAAATFMGIKTESDGNYEESKKHFNFVITQYDPTLHKDHGRRFGFDTRAWALSTLSLVYLWEGKINLSIQSGKESVTYAREVNHIPSIIVTLIHCGLFYQHMGDKEGAKKVSKEILELTEEYGLIGFVGYAGLIHNWATDEKVEKSERIFEDLLNMGCKTVLSKYGSFIAETKAKNGDLDGAIHQIDRCIELAIECDEYLDELILYRKKATFLFEKDPNEHKTVKSLLDKARAMAHQCSSLLEEAWIIKEQSRIFGMSQSDAIRLKEITTLRADLKSPNPDYPSWPN